jgi:hypothetical protein
MGFIGFKDIPRRSYNRKESTPMITQWLDISDPQPVGIEAIKAERNAWTAASILA